MMEDNLEDMDAYQLEFLYQMKNWSLDLPAVRCSDYLMCFEHKLI